MNANHAARHVATLLCLSMIAVLALAAEPPAGGVYTETFGPESATRWQPLAGDWQFRAGGVAQTKADFDCILTWRDVRPSGAYWLAVRFRPETDFDGGGLLFALPGTDKKNGGMLVRCDPGGRILWGYIDDTGTFNYYGDANYDDDGDREQELAVAVDPEKNAFNLYHHGERIATNVRTFHTQGFVGIQSSGGPHTFLKCELRPARAAELEGLKAPGLYSQVVDVIGDDRYVIALRRGAEVLTAYDAAGQPQGGVKAAELSGGKPDVDLKPVALTWDYPSKDGRRGILVLAGEGRSIWRLDANFKVVGTQALIENAQMQGTALAVDRAGRIFVADAGVPGVRVYSPEGKELLKFGEKGAIAAYDHADAKSAGKFKAPRGIAISSQGLVVVADRENYTYVVYEHNPGANALTYVGNGPWIPYPAQTGFDRAGNLLMAGTFEYYRSYGALRVMTLDGRGQRVFVGHSLRDMSDKVRACQGPGGKYYVVDPDKDRVAILPPDFVEPQPTFKWTADGGVEMTVTKVDGSQVVTTSNERVTLTSPSKQERVRVRQTEPVCATWPALTPNELTTYELPPAPPAGKMYVIDMPILVAVFKQATDEKGKHVEINTDGVIARLQRELAVARHFYWLNSHALLNVQFDYMIVDDPNAKVDGGWIQPTPARQMVNQARARQGLPPLDGNHSLLGIHPMPGFDPNDTDSPGYVGGGGLTPFAYSGYALWNHGQGWLMAHEWGHQLDAYFEKSGEPDWWLNHPDGTVHIGRYGEHWDCNAFLCRRVDALNRLRFQFGTLRLVDDRDGDGLADDDPTLPLDEQRFGSDAAQRDTDGDGLDDLGELTAGTFTSSDPRNADTNSNGIPDAQDPHPQFAVGTRLNALQIEANGTPRAAGYARLGQVHRPWCAVTAAGAYDGDHVYLLVALEKPVKQVLLTVDFNDDGWFVGQDNVFAQVELEWKDGQPSVKRASNCEAQLYPQVAAPDVLPGGVPVLGFRVERPDARAALMAGEHVGITLRVADGGGTSGFLLDPWQDLSLECQPAAKRGVK